MNRRQFLLLLPLSVAVGSTKAVESLSMEDAIRRSVSRTTTPKVSCSLTVVGDLKAKMGWDADRSQTQRTIDCFKEWADLVLRNRNGTGFVLAVGEDRYSVDKNLLCTPMEK